MQEIILEGRKAYLISVAEFEQKIQKRIKELRGKFINNIFCRGHAFIIGYHDLDAITELEKGVVSVKNNKQKTLAVDKQLICEIFGMHKTPTDISIMVEEKPRKLIRATEYDKLIKKTQIFYVIYVGYASPTYSIPPRYYPLKMKGAKNAKSN